MIFAHSLFVLFVLNIFVLGNKDKIYIQEKEEKRFFYEIGFSVLFSLMFIQRHL